MKVQDNLLNQKMLERLVFTFNRLMSDSFDTVLQGGGHEPLYQARKNKNLKHQIVFTHDYISSALHETAHWCLAGAERRKMDDYGYWYAPDGRSPKEQIEFEQCEVKPQALEWILSRACGVSFRVSADNLETGSLPSRDFKKAIFEQVKIYCSEGLPKRASVLALAFYSEFLLPMSNSVDLFQAPFLISENYSLEELG